TRMLGPLERQLISVLRRRREATAREILDELRSGERDLAYTTVNTILGRLHRKGLIGRRSEPYKGGYRYIYQYKDIEARYIDNILDGLIVTFGHRAVVHLAERLDRLSEEDSKRIRERLRQ
ncbi:MAG TPA: BlaI/MecI/CopY family transcriptional regulator, partial [Thermoplasmata archaeon]